MAGFKRPPAFSAPFPRGEGASLPPKPKTPVTGLALEADQARITQVPVIALAIGPGHAAGHLDTVGAAPVGQGHITDITPIVVLFVAV